MCAAGEVALVRRFFPGWRVGWMLLLAVVLIVAGCGGVPAATPTVTAAQAVMVISEAGQFEALRSQGRPAVLVLTESSHSCGCEALLPVIDEVAATYRGQIAFAMADRSDTAGRVLYERHGGQVLGQPWLVFFDKRGQAVHRAVMISAAELQRELERLLGPKLENVSPGAK